MLSDDALPSTGYFLWAESAPQNIFSLGSPHGGPSHFILLHLCKYSIPTPPTQSAILIKIFFELTAHILPPEPCLPSAVQSVLRSRGLRHLLDDELDGHVCIVCSLRTLLLNGF